MSGKAQRFFLTADQSQSCRIPRQPTCSGADWMLRVCSKRLWVCLCERSDEERSGADAYDSCMCTLVDPESESFVPIEKGFEVEQVPKAIVVSQEKVTRSQWATPAIGAIRLNLI